MITRPVITGAFSLNNSKESSLHAILIDDSFSMQGNEYGIKRSVDMILQTIPDNSRIIWQNINSGIKYRIRYLFYICSKKSDPYFRNNFGYFK